MLVLQRKKGESLLLGENIRVSVVDVGADGVRLAIDAPKEIKILRAELAEAVQANQESVAGRDQLRNIRNMIAGRKK